MLLGYLHDQQQNQSELKKQSMLSLGGSFDWGSTTIACACEGGADKSSLDAVNRQTAAAGYRMSALIAAIVTSDPFLKRKRDTAAR